MMLSLTIWISIQLPTSVNAFRDEVSGTAVMLSTGLKYDTGTSFSIPLRLQENTNTKQIKEIIDRKYIIII